ETFVESYGDTSGIAFSGNHVAAGGVVEQLSSQLEAGPVEFERAENGLLYPSSAALTGIGAPRDLKVVALDQVGARWYPKPDDGGVFGISGTVHKASPGDDTLVDIVAAASDGDVIELAPGIYTVNRAIQLDKSLTIKGAPSHEKGEKAEPVVIQFARPTLFELREGGNLQLQFLTVDGILAPDSVGNSMIRTTSYPIQSNLQIEMDGVTVRNLVVNKSFNVLTLGKSSMADRVEIKNSQFADITGAIVSAAAETEDYGQYNVEYLDIVDSKFADVGGPVADIYRGGRDESTFGPYVKITGNELANVGLAVTNASQASINLHGVQTTDVRRNQVVESGAFRFVHTVGTPKTSITENRFIDTPDFILEELIYEGDHRASKSGNQFAYSEAAVDEITE
ncbi:MAG: hypothetical protein AAGK02_11900, partial [Pseudomonadota bacterium]